MSTYRSRLEAGVHPGTDPRRGAELRAELRRLAAALTPRWRPTGERDDFGSALLQIGARLAEETTQRLDRTARRDALAFYDLLGLPPGSPRPATGVLVLALGPKHVLPVHAPARTQVAVTTAGGQEVTFETQDALRVVPGGIGELLAVDPASDRIETAPARVTTPAAPDPVPGHYRLLTFAGPRSVTLQLAPAAGLATDDVLRIGTAAYRVLAAEKNGLVTLRDPLEAPAPAGTTATRITALEAFTLRNVQRHVVHVGHTELLNLEQRAKIVLDLSPAPLARELSRLDLRYSMFGTLDGADEPAWHRLDLLGTRGSEVRLAKSWVGKVQETEVHGRTSRWLRAELAAEVTGPSGPTSRASGLRLTVVSVADGAAGATGASGSPAPGPAEGSRTVVRAAHNGTPLATTRRFFPFGPEPLRFDTFTLAAPEALSKKGATATLAVTMVDSSMLSLGIATTAAPDNGSWRGYGVGQNGDLEVLLPDGERGLRWLETGAVAEDGRRVLLGVASPVAVERPGGGDVVVVADRDGALWSAVVRSSGTPPVVSVEDSTWTPLGGPGPAGGPGGAVVLPAPAGIAGTSAVVLDVHDGALHALRLDPGGRPAGAWTEVRPPGGGDPVPVLSEPGRLTPVQGAGWPGSPDRLEVLARDDDAALWVATLAEPPGTGRLTATWTRLVDDGTVPVPPARPDVGPAATRYRAADGTEHLWVCFAAAGTAGGQQLCGIDRVDDAVTVYPFSAAVAAGSALHANPGVRGVGGLPTTVGLGAGRGEVFVWQGGEDAATTVLPHPASSDRPLLIQSGRAPQLLLPGTGERLLRGTVPPPREVEHDLHDLVELESDWVPNRVEITAAPGDPAASTVVELGPANRRIVEDGVRVYEMDDHGLAAGTTLRFLRVTGTTYTGTFEPPESRTRLRLGPADTTATTPGARLVIGDASYVVSAVTQDRVATLEPDVASDETETEYRVVEAMATRSVTDDQLGTLARLRTNERPHELVLGPPARPRTQQVRRAETSGKSVWVRLGRAWGTAPAESTAVAITDPPTWTQSVRERGYRNPELSWEYSDGDGWRRLEKGFLDGTDNLSTSGTIGFVVPQDLTTTEIGGKEDYWIRARLVGGDYGRPSYVVRQESGEDGVTEQTVVVDTSALHPPEILAIEAAFSGPAHLPPEVLLVENNVDVVDQTQAAAVASASFDLFQGAAALDAGAGRAVYAGLTAPVGGGPLTLLVDAEDQPGTQTLQADLRTPDGWRRVPVDDRTASLRRTGTITLSLDADPVAVRLFGRDRVWLRLRPGSVPAPGTPPGSGGGDRPWAPVVRALLPNAVGISQARTIENEVLGSSLGAPGTTVFLADVPVLPDSVELRVREDLSDEELRSLEDRRRPGEGRRPVPVAVSGLERAPGTWVLWRRVDSLVGQDGDARVFVLEPSSGRVTFGDGRSGRIPPAGRDGIRCFTYQQGGGAAGNLPPWSQVRLTTAVEGVEAAVLPVGTAGGVDAPPADSVFATAPQQLRHAGRALTPADVEALAVASSGDVLRARCRRPDRPGGPIRVAVAVRDGTVRCPRPTSAQLEAVAAHVRRSGWAGLAETSVRVTGPAYVPVAVTAALVAPPERWADVEHSAKELLVDLFDPVRGGPDGTGWPFGRRPTSADLLRALAPVPGIDRVAAVGVTPLDGPATDRWPDDGLVCAEAEDISVVVTEGGGA